jgi:hypothetical protein
MNLNIMDISNLNIQIKLRKYFQSMMEEQDDTQRLTYLVEWFE